MEGISWFDFSPRRQGDWSIRNIFDCGRVIVWRIGNAYRVAESASLGRMDNISNSILASVLKSPISM
ncbi:hypothetical protein [Paenibacillus swuensis]|uniref:hypothetical protein n=1 Tax=Paenibacillus swuensis TaxID=1178515 RepID=UPI0018D2F5AD|nr:hypothetical protein [Paenibacillus swuensis]